MAGPEAGGGPPPLQSLAKPPEEDLQTPQVPASSSVSSPSSPAPQDQNLRAEVLFQNLAGEPYSTVFANPPSSFCQPYSESSMLSDAAPKPDEHMFIRNLDNGEFRRLGDGALTMSFVSEHVHPSELASRNTASPWSGWWADKRARDERLSHAAQSGNLEDLRMALAKPTDGSPPASVAARFLHGRTALHFAAANGTPGAVELLLDAGADIEAHTDAGFTALHLACQLGLHSVAILLLDWGANIIAETNDRNLPIHYASMNGHTDIVLLLLERGGDEQLLPRNSLGQRPAEVSMDIRTADAIKQFQSTTVSMSNTASIADKYAGRTPFQNGSGSVLLRNARADVVCRILNKTQHPPDMRGTSFGDMLASRVELPEEEQDRIFRQNSRKSSPTSTARSTRAPFAQLRQDGPSIEKVGPDSFVFMERLGKGSFGEVFQVKHRRTGQICAMKILRKNKVMTGNYLRYAVTERNVLTYINHPYMVSLHFAFQTSSYLVLVLQFCPGGNLQRLIEREKKLPETLTRLYSAEILLGLIYLHDRQIVFRDLKPDNVVIDDVGHCMLTDFGLSKEGVTALHGTKSFCGSIAFLAPEIILRRGHNQTVDTYGLGVLLFDMLVGLPPFYHPDRETLFNNIKHARLQIPRSVSKPASALITELMVRDPVQRLGARGTADIKKHEFFSSVDFEMLMRREVPVPMPLPEPRARSLSRHGRPENPFNVTSAPSGESRDVSGWSFSES